MSLNPVLAKRNGDFLIDAMCKPSFAVGSSERQEESVTHYRHGCQETADVVRRIAQCPSVEDALAVLESAASSLIPVRQARLEPVEGLTVSLRLAHVQMMRGNWSAATFYVVRSFDRAEPDEPITGESFVASAVDRLSGFGFQVRQVFAGYCAAVGVFTINDLRRDLGKVLRQTGVGPAMGRISEALLDLCPSKERN